MKKILLPVMTAAICLSASHTAFAQYSFSDISGSQYEWCADQIQSMHEAGYVNGYEDGTYRPDNQVTKLEGIALFARAMGSSNEANIEAIELGHEQYDSAINTCSLPWGTDEIAYMMYKGAFTAADLTTYLSGAAKNEAMTRGEAAVIITKAMGGESVIKGYTSVSLDYKDARDIPSNILPYVKYVSDEGIMNGIEYEFLADGTVTRSQMAVMLARVVESCGYSFEQCRIETIDTDSNEITLLVDGESEVYEITDNTLFYIRGSQTQLSEMPDNVSAIVQFADDELVAVDSLSKESDKIVTAVYSGYNTMGNHIELRAKVDGAASVSTYVCVANVPITYQGSPATIKSLKAGDVISLSISNGEIQSISASEKAETISSATVSSLNIEDGELYITIESGNDDYNGMKYPVATDAEVKKNSKTTTMSDVYVGDKVTLKILYGKVTEVTATSTYTTVSGSISSILISDMPEITVKVEGKDKTYQVPSSCNIQVNGETGSVYDLRVGDSLTLTVQSDAVTKIVTTSTVVTTDGKVDGVVTAVNTSYGFISVLMDGSETPVTVFCNDNKTKFMDYDGDTIKMASISIGDTVECRGTTTTGAFSAKFVIVSD